MPPKVVVLPDHETVSARVAERLQAFVAHHPNANLALPSGQTPVRTYAHLSRAIAEGRLAVEALRVFALDEYVGIPAEDERSFAHFFQEHVVGPWGLRPEQFSCLDGTAENLEEEAARYEALLARSGGLSLTLLGLGGNGHIAFNEPASRLQARTHVGTLQPPSSLVSPKGLTMGVATLLEAPDVWLMATGESKAPAVHALLSGWLEPSCPASLLQAHPRAEIFLDEAAAALL